MNPVTHLLASWTIADLSALSDRDRKIVTWSGVVPDADGLTLLPDLFNRLLFNKPTEFYQQYHRLLTHGLPAALVVFVVALLKGQNRLKVALLAFVSFHFHLFCDLIGSRGPDPSDIWPIYYFAPLSDHPVFYWTGQWPLNAWPNIVFTIALMTVIFVRAYYCGYSVVGLFSQKTDEAFVSALRVRFGANSTSR